MAQDDVTMTNTDVPITDTDVIDVTLKFDEQSILLTDFLLQTDVSADVKEQVLNESCFYERFSCPGPDQWKRLLPVLQLLETSQLWKVLK